MNTSKPRIVLGVTDAFSLRLMKGLPEALMKAGWDVHIVSGGGMYGSVYASTSIASHEIPMTRKPSPITDLKALRKWVSLIKTLAPDIVFIGTPKAGLLGILSSWISRVPARVYHLRGLRLETTRGLHRAIYWTIEKLVCSLSTEIISVSPSLRNKMIDLKLVSASKIDVLGSGSSNGVDITRFSPRQRSSISSRDLGLQAGIPVIGFVGRITKDKGNQELLEASRILHQRGVEHQLLFVGPKEETMTNSRAYEELVNTVFTGTVPDTAPYYSLMDIFCLPTHREGFPNVVLEAGASGTATVTTNATGAVDSVIDGITGKVVRARSSCELAEALEYLLLNVHEREDLGASARRYVEKNFQQETIQNEILNFLCKQVEQVRGACR